MILAFGINGYFTNKKKIVRISQRRRFNEK